MINDPNDPNERERSELHLAAYRKLNETIEEAIEHSRKHDSQSALNRSIKESQVAIAILFFGLTDSSKRICFMSNADLALELKFARGTTASLRRLIDWIDESYNRIEQEQKK